MEILVVFYSKYMHWRSKRHCQIKVREVEML